jgi:antitoxin YefM
MAASRRLGLHCADTGMYSILYVMDTITYTKARAQLAETMERVCEDHAPIIITKKDESVVMMSLADYKAMQETTYLLRSPANARRLLESIAQLEKGGGRKRKLAK